MSQAVAPPQREFTRRSVPAALAATIGLMTSAPIIVSAPVGLYVIPVTEAFGIGRGAFGLIAALGLLAGALLTPLVGRAIDRYGVRRLVLPGVVALAAVQALLSQAPLNTFVLGALIVLQGASGALVTTLAYSRVLSLWFHKRRGVVLATTAAVGSGGGAGISTLMAGALMEAGGWRLAYLGAAIYLLLALPVLYFFLREPAVVATSPAEGDAAPVLSGLTLREALQTNAFRLVLAMIATSIGALAIMMAHGPALLAGRDLASLGPGFLAASALGSMTGQLISGPLLDRIDSPRVGLPFAIAALIGGLVLLHAGFSAAVVLPAAFVMGLGQGAEFGLAGYYVSRFCGLRAFGAIFGIVVALVTLLAGAFPMLAGVVFDKTGSYDALIPMLDALLLAAVIAIALMPRYRFAARADIIPA